MPNHHDVLVTAIIIGDRFRKDYGDLSGLKASITEYGVLQPILIDRENNLMAGGRRLQSCIELGRSRISALYFDEIDETKRREIELEENLHREELKWHERNALIAEIHRLKTAKHEGETKVDPDSGASSRGPYQTPAWNQTKTAELLGVSQYTVSESIQLAAVVEAMPELKNEDNENQARKKIDRRIEELEREIEFRRLQKAGDLALEGQVILGDCVTELTKLADTSVDCIIIDPPYGVLEAGGIDRYASGVHFNDDPVEAMAKLRLAAIELKRIAKPDAHWYIFFGIKMFTETVAIFTALDLPVDPIPIIWIKTTGSVVDWDYRYSNYYEPALFISNKTRRLAPGKHSNVFSYDSIPVSERSNIAEKPLPLIQHLIRNSTKEGDLVLDCFAGSGVTAVAAKSLKRRFIVMEQNESLWKHIQNRLATTVIQDSPTQPTDESSPDLSSSLALIRELM